MGLNFQRFTLYNRLGHAAPLLLSTEWPIESIASHLGFADGRHFQRYFARC